MAQIEKRRNAWHRSQISLHELDNYTFGTKEAKPEKDSLVKRMGRMTEKYKEEGMRRTVECVLLLQNKQHPHVLLLQQGQGQNAVFRLPGGRLRPGEGELEGTRRKLSSKLAPVREQESQTHQAKWMVEEQLAVWWRPNFETLMCAALARPRPCRPPRTPRPCRTPRPPRTPRTPRASGVRAAQVPVLASARDQAEGMQADLHGTPLRATGLRCP